ncbi:MAG: sulfurtransferase TusA family protein [Candidatus Brocadiia bacterium]
MDVLDCRGEVCPLPVIKAREFFIRNPRLPVTVLVTQPNQCENVASLADRFNRDASKEERPGHFAVIFGPEKPKPD